MGGLKMQGPLVVAHQVEHQAMSGVIVEMQLPMHVPQFSLGSKILLSGNCPLQL